MQIIYFRMSKNKVFFWISNPSQEYPKPDSIENKSGNMIIRFFNRLGVKKCKHETHLPDRLNININKLYCC